MRERPGRGPTRLLVFGASFLATGASLVLYLVSGVSLGASIVATGSLALAAAGAVWMRANRLHRLELRRGVRAGLLAGLLATAAYDVSRYLLVEVFALSLWPFDTFTLFGQALLGSSYEGWRETTVGTLYHLANGIGFGIAYTLWLGGRGAVAGVCFALGLEAAMLTLYPGWLDIRAIEEFVSISLFGHVAYGAVLGVVAQRLLGPAPDGSA